MMSYELTSYFLCKPIVPTAVMAVLLTEPTFPSRKIVLFCLELCTLRSTLWIPIIEKMVPQIKFPYDDDS